MVLFTLLDIGKEGGQFDRTLVNNTPHLVVDDRLMANCAPGSSRRRTRGAMMINLVLHLAWTGGGSRGNMFRGLCLESLL